MNILFRKAVLPDIESLVGLLNHLLNLEGDYPNNRENQVRGFEMLIREGKSDIFVAELEGEVVGMCCLHKLISSVEGGYVGQVEDVVVREDMNGRGIGSRMLDFLEQEAKKAGLTRLQLMVDKGNDPAIFLYKKLGWSETKYYGFRKYI